MSIVLIDFEVALLGPKLSSSSYSDSLLDNLNEQEFLLKRLNETFIELKANGVIYKSDVNSECKIESLNERWKNLTSSLAKRVHTLRGIITSSPVTLHVNSFDMTGSVSMPWKRIIAINEYPFYTNTQNACTSWDHPHMSVIIDSLCRYDDIKYCAYRTSMKLRALQQWLLLNLCDIQKVSTAFLTEFICTPEFDKTTTHDSNISVSKLLTILRRLFEVAAIANSTPINIPRATDICLNWLILLYDPERKGVLKAYSCQAALVIMCNATIEDKYSYLFDMTVEAKLEMSTGDFQKFIATALAIPNWLNEVDAFGGCEALPSLKSFQSYFSKSCTINKDEFMAWLRMEPQSIVWIPVLHRLVASEGIRHEAKCNVCKEYPIIGFRYRSLKRFNFDVCQKCFFLGTKIPSIDDPLQEYYVETTSSDDIRDFFKIFTNKLKKSVHIRNKLGYLPLPPSTKTSIRVNGTSQITKDLINKSQIESTQVESLKSVGEHLALASYCRILDNNKNNNDFSSDNAYDLSESIKNDARLSVDSMQMDNRMLRDEYIRLTEQHYSQCLAKMLNSKQFNNKYRNGDGNLDLKDEQHNSPLFVLYKNKLEKRLSILEKHNNELEEQLHQVKSIINKRPQNNRNSTNALPARSNSVLLNKDYNAINDLFRCASGVNTAIGDLISVMSEQKSSQTF
ncbi:hypothetical protein GJ496_002956 [Pomphorhynchus laevis]|nr:hypothetical protein GJ496_002956 [Pomphorhynchus laevis]